MEQYISDILKRFSPERKNLIAMLHEVQNSSGYSYISNDAVNCLSDYLALPVSEIDAVISFYSMFSRKKRTKYVIRVCDSIVCRVCGSFDVMDYLSRKLHLNFEQRSEDGLFSLEIVNCLGGCDKAPNMLINDTLYSNLDNDKIDEIIEMVKAQGTC